MTKPLRIAFMGTPDFVVSTMQTILESDHELVCVYTQPPRAKGRKQQLQNTPVHVAAKKIGIEVRHPLNFKDAAEIESFKNLNLDIAVVAAYGLLLPQEILDAPAFGCLNIHPSLLPRWRGPSPIQYAIWKGDKETGVSVMRLEKSMDTGPVIVQAKEPITEDTNFVGLNDILWRQGNLLLSKALDDIARDRVVKSTPQNDAEATYCKLFTKEQGHVDWNQSAKEISQQVRGLNPWPGTWGMVDGKRLKILEVNVLIEKSSEKSGIILEQGKVSCGNQSVLQLVRIQPENKNVMDIKTAINGGHINTGDIFL